MKINRVSMLVGLTLLILGIGGCAKKEVEAVTPAGSAALIVGDWLLIDPASVYAVTLRVSDAGRGFISAYGVRFEGQSSVNQYFGTASFSEGPTIESGATGTGSVSTLGVTQKGGAPEAMQFEDTYFDRLRAVNKAEVIGQNRLLLSHGGTKPGTLVYERQ